MMLTVTAIDSFEGEDRFLSNFYPAIIRFDGLSFPTVENAYQAAKTLNPQERMLFEYVLPGKAKRMGKKVTKRSDWSEVKLSIMEELLRQKFADEHLKDKLLHTRNLRLIEGNVWNDTFWGVCKGVGENHLGKLLMKIRDELGRQ